MSERLIIGIVLLTERQAAERLALSVHWLRKQRVSGRAVAKDPVPYYKIAGAVRYSAADLDAWLARRRVA